MKRTLIFVSLIFAATTMFAQKGKVSSALNLKDSGKLDKALEAIEEAIDPNNPKAASSISWPRTWEVRGEIYQDIARSGDANIKKLATEPLTKAFESYKKALELDEKGRNGKAVKVKLVLLENDLQQHGNEEYNKENYANALTAFEQILEMKELPVMKEDGNPIDTATIWNAALIANVAKNYDKAIKYYKEVAELGYNDGVPYEKIAEAYQAKGDTATALNVLQEGFKKYPTDNNVLVGMINIYLKTNKAAEAVKYLDMAIAQDPTNPSYYYAKGSLYDYDRLNNFEIAKENYEKAIELDPNNANAFYNLGALYYNGGVNQHKIAIEVPVSQNERYEAELKKADEWFRKAVPYMEKASELTSDDGTDKRSILETLSNLYYRLDMSDKYKETQRKLGREVE